MGLGLGVGGEDTDADLGLYHVRFDADGVRGEVGPAALPTPFESEATTGTTPVSTPAAVSTSPPAPGEPEPSNLCVICMDAPKCVVLMPCKHYCLCEGCSGLVQQCPVCRRKIIHSMKIFDT